MMNTDINTDIQMVLIYEIPAFYRANHMLHDPGLAEKRKKKLFIYSCKQNRGLILTVSTFNSCIYYHLSIISISIIY